MPYKATFCRFQDCIQSRPFCGGCRSAVDDISLAGPSNVVLPVTIISLTGINQGGNNLLNWKSATEQNSSQYEVERSLTAPALTRLAQLNR